MHLTQVKSDADLPEEKAILLWRAAPDRVRPSQ